MYICISIPYLRCLNDSCFRLCNECDKVFHKSAAKKSHIRIPITHGDRRCTATSIEGVLREGGCLRAVVCTATSKLNDVCARPLRRWSTGRKAAARSSSSSSSDATACTAMESLLPSVSDYKECVSCILLAGIRGLLDDGKVRRGSMLTSIIAGCSSLSLAQCMHASSVMQVRQLDTPYEVYPLLLRIMRTVVSCRASTATPADALLVAWDHHHHPTTLSDRLGLSSLVDNGRDGRMMGGGSGPHNSSSSSRSSIDSNLHLYAQPPEVHGSSPRRILLCLLTQCISRFLVHEPDLSSGPRLPLPASTSTYQDAELDLSELYALQGGHVGARPGSSRQLDQLMQGTCIALLLLLGIDAVFAHLCTSASSSCYVQVTSVDRQFIIWLLRETIVTARRSAAEGEDKGGGCCSSHMQDRLYKWLGWMAKGDVNKRLHGSTGGAALDLSSRLRGPLATASISMKDGLMPSPADTARLSAAHNTVVAFKGGSVSAVVINCAALPPSAPSIPVLLRLLVLQELILLMSSDLEAAVATSSRCCSPLAGTSSGGPSPLTYRSHLPLEPAPTWIDNTWTENKAAVLMTSHAANQNKRSSQRSRHRSSSHGHLSTARDHPHPHPFYFSEKSLLHCAMTCTRSAKQSMVRLGFVELFSDLVMGDLRSAGIVQALQNSNNYQANNNWTSSQHSSAVGRSGRMMVCEIEPLSDLEIEDWWMAFSAFVQLLQGCDEAKERLLECRGVEKTIGLVLFLQEFIASSSARLEAPSSSSRLDYSPVLSCLVVELCTRCGQFSPPNRAFVAALARYPRGQQPSSKKAEADSPGAAPPLPVAGLEQLFLRSSSTVRCGPDPYHHHHHQHHHHPDVHHLDVHQEAALAPFYFTQSRLTNMLHDVCSARPLSFMQGSSFRQAFAAVDAGSSSSIHTPVPSSQSLAVGRSGKAPLVKATSTDSLSELFSRAGGGRPSVESIDSTASSSHGIIGGTHSLLLGKRFAQKMNNSHHSSYEHDSQRWEMDSLASSTIGSTTARSFSLHSSHSLAVLSQALHGGGDTPTPSISGGDNCCNNNAMTNTIHPAAAAAPRTKRLSRASSAEHMQKPSTGQPTISGLFPPTAGDGDCSAPPSVYVPLLKKFDGGREQLATSVLLLLHHALLIRSSGSSFIEAADADAAVDRGKEPPPPSQQRSSSDYSAVAEDKMDSLYASSSAKLLLQEGTNKTTMARQQQQLTNRVVVILRKHLSMFVPSTIATMTTNSDPLAWTQRELPHCPPYSRLQIASADSCELLVSVAVVSSTCWSPSNQTYLFSAISHLIDGNPANAFKFVQRPSICITMIQMLPHLQEQCQQMVGYILSQSLRYSVQMPALRELIRAVLHSKMSTQDAASTADGYYNAAAAATDHHHHQSSPCPPDDEECSSSSSSGSKTLLFVMGRTAERTAPDAFLHFDCSCPFVAKVELPSIAPSLVPLTDGITICAWIRLGTLANSHAVTLLQLYTEDTPSGSSSNSSEQAHVLVNAYFRVVYRLCPVGPSSSSSSSSTMRSQQQRVSKRVVQLCFGFRKTIHHHHHHHPLLSEGPTDPSLPPSEAETAGGSSHSHWHAAVDQLSSESCFPSDSDSSPSTAAAASSHHGAIAKLANTINHYAIPDAIVEFDWTEMGEWHLLCISLGPHLHSVGCSVDGVQKPVAHWTPLGYRRHRCAGEEGEPHHHQHHHHHSLGDRAASVDDATMQPTTAPSSAPYCDFTKITKDSPLKVILGGLQYECASWQVLQSHARRTSPLLHALSSLMAGFAGSMGEVAVLAGGPPDAFALHCMVRAGPGQGLRDLKALPRLSELTSHHMMSSSLTAAAAGGSSGVFPISIPCLPSDNNSNNSNKERVDYAMHDSPALIYSSNITMTSTATAAAKRDIITLKGKEAPSSSSVIGLRLFSESVQVHRTSNAASTLKHMGGLRLLYPLLVLDKARLVAALRMMGSIVLSSPEAYKDFQSSDTDKVLLYCALQQPSLITLETLQVLFDLICNPAPPSSSPSLFPRGVGPLSECSEVIHRQTLLDLLFLIVLSSRNNSNCQLARSAVDWMREICDDEVHNCQKLLKTSGLVPVLIMLSVWDVCGQEPLPHAVKSHIPQPQPSSIRSSSEAPPPMTAEATLDPSKPISDSHHHHHHHHHHSSSSSSEATAAELASLANKYKLQVSCYRLVKLLITGTSGEVDRGRVGSSLSHTVTDFGAAHLSVLLSFIATTSS